MAEPDPHKDSDREPADPPDEEEGETYELVDETPPAKSHPAPKPHDANANATADSSADADPNEEETYELAEEPERIQDPAKRSPTPSGSASAAPPPAEILEQGTKKADTKPKSAAPSSSTGEQAPPSGEQPMRDKSGKPLPKQWSTEEPEFVDPEVARLRREEQRKRAAEEEAIRAAKATKIKLAALGVLLLIAAAVVAYFSFVR